MLNFGRWSYNQAKNTRRWEGEEEFRPLICHGALANCVVTLGDGVVPKMKAFAREKVHHRDYGGGVLIARRTGEASRATILVHASRED